MDLMEKRLYFGLGLNKTIDEKKKNTIPNSIFIILVSLFNLTTNI